MPVTRVAVTVARVSVTRVAVTTARVVTVRVAVVLLAFARLTGAGFACAGCLLPAALSVRRGQHKTQGIRGYTLRGSETVPDIGQPGQFYLLQSGDGVPQAALQALHGKVVRCRAIDTDRVDFRLPLQLGIDDVRI